MAWTLSNAGESFAAKHHCWDELNARVANHVLLDAVFVQALLDHFSAQPVLLAHETSTSAPAMLLLCRQGAGRWQTFAPSQAPLGNALFGDRTHADAQLGALLRQLPGSAMLLGVMHQDPESGGLAAQHDAGAIETVHWLQTGRVRRSPGFDHYWQQRPADLRDGNARRHRRLQKQGTQERLCTLREPGQIEQGLHHYCAMEETGWKAAAGTAVSMTNAQGRFYRSVLLALCTRGEAAIHELRFDDKPVASQLCLQRGGMSVSLKISFDESQRRDAPGYLLQELIVRQLHQDPALNVIEFYGPATDGWTRKWTDDLRPMHHLNVYRNTAVRLAAKLARRVYSQVVSRAATAPPEAVAAPPATASAP